MIQLHTSQYSAFKVFSKIVKKDLEMNPAKDTLSSSVLMIGQDFGFCKDEIREISEMCLEELRRN